MHRRGAVLSIKNSFHQTFKADIAAKEGDKGDFYTFAVCKNAVFFAAVIILLCNVECGSWPEIPTDLRTYRNSLIPSSSANVRPCAIFPVTKILLLHFDCHIYISVPYITPHTELQM